MFKDYNQGQNFLLPPNFKEFIGENHESIILDELINELDLSELINSYSNKDKGTSAYHPKMLLKIMIYGYMNKTFSSRKIAKKLKSDLAFMYLSGNNQPNFRTINNFRKDKGEHLEKIFVQIVLKAKYLGLINFGTLNLDGTKIYANASKYKNENEEKIEKQIQKLINKAEEIDKIEDKEYGEKEDNIPKDLKTSELRNKKRKELKEKEEQLKKKLENLKSKIEKKKQEGINQTTINKTDEDSRLMKMKRKDWGNGYNPQNITQNQFVVSTNISNNSNDTNELIPSIEKFKNQYGIKPDKIVADAGYGTEKNYEYNEKENIESYIPHPEYSQTDLKELDYNEKDDTYTDKDRNIFKFKQYFGRINGKVKRGRPKKSEIQNPEDFKGKKYMTILEDGTKKYLQVSKNLKEIFKRNDERLYSEEGKEIYRKRSGDVEVPFGNIKFNLGFERFLLRGFEKVQIEWNLINIAHNMGKLIKFTIG